MRETAELPDPLSLPSPLNTNTSVLCRTLNKVPDIRKHIRYEIEKVLRVEFLFKLLFNIFEDLLCL